MSGPIIYVIDDQPAVRHALAEMLGVFGFEVTAFGSAAAFLEALDTNRRAVIVADVRMPGMDGISLVRELGRRRAKVPVVLISGHADVPMAVEGIKAGAQDFIEKPIDDAVLIGAINRALAQQGPTAPDALHERFERLTGRQVEIFDLVAQGFTNNAIATKLAISVRTVESYRAQVMEKMQAESVAALVRQAIRLGRIEA